MSERDIFTAVREMTDPLARAAYLDGACGDDAGLRSRVEALLRAHDRPDSLLDRPAVAPDGTGFESTVAIEHEGGAAGDEIPLGFLAPATRPDSLGRIGHYEVLQVLGQGGFGIVFRAFDDVLHRVVAVKVLSPVMAATSPARKRFLREARSSAQVRHENVVQVYEVGEQPLPYIAMEFIPGETLQQRLNRVGPVEPAEVVRVGRQISEGLAAAHANDLIHRDIKPGNILLEGGAQRVKITDFGLARAADDASISQSGIIAGTPMYMAPEQAKGEKLDQRADLFSLGSVLYVMASGRPPFRANSTVAVLKRVADDTPRPIREIIPESPQWLCDIIAKLHAKDPDDRFQTAREVADVLADCEGQLKANARLKDFSRIPRSKPAAGRSGRWKWVAAAVLLPVLALAVTESAGVTHLFRVWRTITDPIAGGGERQAETTGWHGLPADAPEPAAAPFDAAQARAHQEAWARYLGAPVEYTNSVGMKFVLIPPGEFMMGSTPAEIEVAAKAFNEWPSRQDQIRSEAPRHRVILTRPFYLGVCEVTQAEYEQVERRNPSYFAATGEGKEAVAKTDTKRHPVELVSWNDAADFCSELSRQEQYRPFDFQTGQRVRLLGGTGYRLPSEAEWEFACRAGTTTRYWIGDADDDLARAGWFDRNDGGRTHAVGELKANPFGLYDVHGNVWEWVLDGWDSAAYAPFRERPATDPCTPCAGALRRVFRGGLMGSTAVECRAASRNALEPSARHKAVGFRVVLPVARTPSGAPSAGTQTPPTAPFSDADVQRIATLPAEVQVEEVRKELMRRNPGFDGKVEHKIEDGVVTEFRIVTDQVTDVAPIRAFNALRVLECRGKFIDMSNGLLADLTPLKGMNLADLTHLNLRDTKVSDGGMVNFKDCTGLTTLILADTQVGDAGLAHVKNCKALEHLDLGRTGVGNAGLDHFRGCTALTSLWLCATNVGDAGLSPFRDCKSLTSLDLSGTRVSDVGLAQFQDCKGLTRLWLAGTQVGDAGLAHLKGMPLQSLWIYKTGVTDLTPLQGMPLEEIRLTPKNITRGLDILRAMKGLKTIGIEWDQSWPAAEFWERYDKGEFNE